LKSTQPTPGRTPPVPNAKCVPMPISIGERPFKELRADALLRKVQAAALKKDYVVATYCHEEAEHRRKRTRRRIARALRDGAIEPVEWLRKSEAIANSFQRKTSGRHHVYIVLLEGFAAVSRYGVYVGESCRTPAKRFEQHKAGYNAAGAVLHKGRCLLPHLYAHLNPLGKKEAKDLERRLGDAFRGSGIPTRGGH
jgi:hypothetical protein